MRSLALLLVAIALLGAFVLWRSGGGAPPADSRVSDHGGEAIESPLRAENVPASSEAAGVVRQSLPAAQADPRGGAGDVETLHVTVVRDTGAPAAGADVLVPPPDDELTAVQQRALASMAGRLGDEYAERFGERYRTDAGGRVDVPRPHRAVPIAAAVPGALGVTPWDGRSPTVEIRLERDTTLTVDVREPGGAPTVGVRIALRMRYAGREQPASKWLGVTDDRGRYQCRHFQRMVATIVRQEHGRPDAAEVVVKEPGIGVAGVALDLEVPPAQPVLLTMPAHGSVVVRVHDDHGEPLRQACTLHLGALPLPERGIEKMRAMERIELAPGEDRHTFPFVGLGARLQITAGLRGTQLAPSGDAVQPDGTVLGPQRAGDVVTVTFAVADGAPQLCGRAVDPQGRPVTASLELYVAIGNGRRVDPVTPDAAGRFAAVLDDSTIGERVTAIRTDVQLDDVWRLGAADRDLVVGPGRNDVGTLVIRPSPVLVAGTVVDDAGNPIDDAAIEVRARPAAAGDDDRVTPVSLAPFRPALRRSVGGRFELHGPPPPVPSQLVVDDYRYRPMEPTPFEPGQTDVRVVLHGAGQLEIVVRADRRLEHDELVGMLHDADRHDWPCWGGRRADGDIRLHADRLPPGRYDFTLRLLGDRQPLLRVPDLQVRAGETCDDPRLQGLDLRDRVRFLAVTIVDAGDGATLKHARLHLHDPIVPSEPHWLRPSADRWQVPYDGEPRDVEVTAPGHVGQRVVIETDTTLRLAAAPAVRLRLVPRVALPEGVHVEVRVNEVQPDAVPSPLIAMAAADDPIVAWRTKPDAVDGDRFVFRLDAGRYEVAVFLLGGDGKRSVRVEDVAPATIIVRADDGQQDLDVQIGQASWNAALAKLHP